MAVGLIIGGITAAAAAAAKGITGAVQGAKQDRLAQEQAERLAQADQKYGEYYDQRFRSLQDEAMGNQMALAQSGGSAGAQGSNMRNAMSQAPSTVAAAARAADLYALGRGNQERQNLQQQNAIEMAGQQARQQGVMGLINTIGMGATGAANALGSYEQSQNANARYDEWRAAQQPLLDAGKRRQDAMANYYNSQAAQKAAQAVQPQGLSQDERAEMTYYGEIDPYQNKYQQIVEEIGNPMGYTRNR
jgi:hypothetical protein